MTKPQTKSRLRTAGALMAAAIALVGGWEGLRTVAYRDIVGVPTVCFGETRGVEMGDRYTVEECQVMLGNGLVEFETGMRRCLTNPDAIPGKSYVAFLSLSYNIGTAGFCGSTVARRANEGNYRAACEAILMWNKAGGRVVQGLVNRRQDERRICLEGVNT
jgi:lysozyme